MVCNTVRKADGCDWMCQLDQHCARFYRLHVLHQWPVESKCMNLVLHVCTFKNPMRFERFYLFSPTSSMNVTSTFELTLFVTGPMHQRSPNIAEIQSPITMWS